MGAAMEEARRLLYEKAIKKFTLQEVTKHKTITSKNLIEMLSRYPGNGVGFKVYRKWWPENTFYHVKEVNLYSSRYGQLNGVYYKNGELAGNKIEKIKDVLKRGMWQYQLNDPKFTPQIVTLDNGVQMDLAKTQQLINEKQEFLAKRNKMMELLKEPEPVKDLKKGGKLAVKGSSKVPAKAAAKKK